MAFADGSDTKKFADIAGQSSLLAVGASFLGGFLASLTPCVFPMVPITVSYFTKHAAPTRARAAGSAALYGLGIVLTFTVFMYSVAEVMAVTEAELVMPETISEMKL